MFDVHEFLALYTEVVQTLHSLLSYAFVSGWIREDRMSSVYDKWYVKLPLIVDVPPLHTKSTNKVNGTSYGPKC